ncbi:hypothetical protein RF11_10204 [Thelohanellus kitauei]|uniref:Uncharacterized protein n=1 Tax=Thelohanellus kitauei TaxID=669202 RepID=A0A0C2N6X0_THEKT|nr:hypothetical protein RF11_10204 [Thelohanellus kitauei]
MVEKEAEIAKLEAEQVEKESNMRKQAKDELENWKKEREAMIKERKESAVKEVSQPKAEESKEMWADCLKFIESNSKFVKSTKDTSRIKSAIIKMKEKSASAS